MLETKAKELLKEIDNVMDFAMKELGSNILEDMNESSLKMYQSMIKMYKLSKDYALEQAELLDGINKKLDKLLAK